MAMPAPQVQAKFIHFSKDMDDFDSHEPLVSKTCAHAAATIDSLPSLGSTQAGDSFLGQSFASSEGSLDVIGWSATKSDASEECDEDGMSQRLGWSATKSDASEDEDGMSISGESFASSECSLEIIGWCEDWVRQSEGELDEVAGRENNGEVPERQPSASSNRNPQSLASSGFAVKNGADLVDGADTSDSHVNSVPSRCSGVSAGGSRRGARRGVLQGAAERSSPKKKGSKWHAAMRLFMAEAEKVQRRKRLVDSAPSFLTSAYILSYVQNYLPEEMRNYN